MIVGPKKSFAKMPLERSSNHAFICEPNGVRFVMRDGWRTVLCVLTREALTEVFGSSDQSQWEDIFEDNRAVVEAIASDRYDAGETRIPINVTARDLDPERVVPSSVSALNRSSLLEAGDDND